MLGGGPLPAQASPGATLTYSTYLGGSQHEDVFGGTVDADGNLYITGETDSPNIPLASPALGSLQGEWDAYVTKIDRDGALVYSTYLGGSGSDTGRAIAIDASGNAYVTGSTYSADFPQVGGPPQELRGGTDAFLVKLGPTGEILFSTLIGGNQEDHGSGIAVDPQGRIFLAGTTRSTNLLPAGGLSPALRGQGDGFVMRLAPDGRTIEAGTYLGGSGDHDNIAALVLDGTGHVLVSGLTDSHDFPLAHAVVGAWPFPSSTSAQMSFLTKLAPSLSALTYSTYGRISLYGLAADAAGNALVHGRFDDIAATNPCLSKLDSAGGLLWTSCFGGSSADELTVGITAIALDPAGNILVAGSTASVDFPLKNPLQSECRPIWFEGACFPDMFVTKLDPAGQEILFSTYLGGTQSVQPGGYPPDEGPRSLLVDPRGDVYLAGWTYSGDFPTVNALQPLHGGGGEWGDIDAFALRLTFPSQAPSCAAATATPSLIWPPDGRMVPVSVSGVTDPDGDPVTLTVTGITHDEPASGAESTGIGLPTAQVRAARDGKGDGRLYRIAFEAQDPSGASCTGEVRVCVPHDRRRMVCK